MGRYPMLGTLPNILATGKDFCGYPRTGCPDLWGFVKALKRIVDLDVVGSSPITRPNFSNIQTTGLRFQRVRGILARLRAEPRPGSGAAPE
jgi:hypothetical protein